MGATYWALYGRGECLQTLGDVGEGIRIIMIKIDHFYNPLLANVVHKTASYLSEKLSYFSNAMERILSWEANISVVTEEFPCSVWNFKVHYHIHKNPPFVPVLSQMNAMPSHPFSFRYILMLFSFLCFDLQKGLLTSGFLTKLLYEFLFSLMCAACPVNVIGPDVFSLILFVKGCRLWSPWTHGHD